MLISKQETIEGLRISTLNLEIDNQMLKKIESEYKEGLVRVKDLESSVDSLSKENCLLKKIRGDGTRNSKVAESAKIGEITPKNRNKKGLSLEIGSRASLVSSLKKNLAAQDNFTSDENFDLPLGDIENLVMKDDLIKSLKGKLVGKDVVNKGRNQDLDTCRKLLKFLEHTNSKNKFGNGGLTDRLENSFSKKISGLEIRGLGSGVKNNSKRKAKTYRDRSDKENFWAGNCNVGPPSFLKEKNSVVDTGDSRPGVLFKDSLKNIELAVVGEQNLWGDENIDLGLGFGVRTTLPSPKKDAHQKIVKNLAQTALNSPKKFTGDRNQEKKDLTLDHETQQKLMAQQKRLIKDLEKDNYILEGKFKDKEMMYDDLLQAKKGKELLYESLLQSKKDYETILASKSEKIGQLETKLAGLACGEVKAETEAPEGLDAGPPVGDHKNGDGRGGRDNLLRKISDMEVEIKTLVYERNGFKRDLELYMFAGTKYFNKLSL